MNDFMKYEGQETAAATCANGRQSARLRAAGQSVCPVPAAKSGALQARLCHHPGDAISGTRPATCRSGEHAGAAPDCTPHLAGAWFRDQRAWTLSRYASQRQRRCGAFYNQYVELYGHHFNSWSGCTALTQMESAMSGTYQLARRSVALGLRAGGLSHVCV